MEIAVGAEILIRDIERIPEMRAVELLQKEIWGMADLDVTPLNQIVAAKSVGGILIGAFDGPVLVGFAYGFPGYEDGQPTIHSHLLAVKPEYRNLELGYKLKLQQRAQALARGITRMTWTFDPLQSLNAHFNFGKLGVTAERYEINFYGEETSSFLHRAGTDRLWVSWLLESDRVRQRIEGQAPPGKLPLELAGLQPLVQLMTDGAPRLSGERRHARLSPRPSLQAVSSRIFFVRRGTVSQAGSTSSPWDRTPEAIETS
ncbi:MAG: GNAT family N-acetyltransferase [Blastocatellia bacterium]